MVDLLRMLPALLRWLRDLWIRRQWRLYRHAALATREIEATLERRPRHYHVAVFPSQYAAYVEQLTARGVGGPQLQEYRVRRGDSLWKIARTHGTTVDEIREVNGLRDSQIFVGQVIDVPLGS